MEGDIHACFDSFDNHVVIDLLKTRIEGEAFSQLIWKFLDVYKRQPHNYKPVEDFEITIRENNPDKPQVWKVLLDKEFSAKLKIIKKDDETKKPVLVAGTEFKIYDLDHKKYVEQVTTYPTVTVHKSFFTDSQGYLILPKHLEIGHYRIEEVTAPDGYRCV